MYMLEKIPLLIMQPLNTMKNIEHWHWKKGFSWTQASHTSRPPIVYYENNFNCRKKHLLVGMLFDMKNVLREKKTQLYNMLVDSWKSNEQNGKNYQRYSHTIAEYSSFT